MKTIIRITNLAFIGVLLLACSKEVSQGPIGAQGSQGEQGMQGENGTDGTNGEDGEQGIQGEKGENGTANVISKKFDLSGWNDPSGVVNYSVYWNELTMQAIENDAILFYIKTNHNGRFNPIPGRVIINSISADIELELFTGGCTVISLKRNYNGIGSAYIPVAAGDIDYLRIVIIESSISSKVGANYLTPINKLKAAGVDINNYLQVAEYFGLED